MSRKTKNFRQKSAKRVSYGVPRGSRKRIKAESKNAFFPSEDWHEPVQGERDGYRIIEKDPGGELFHPVSATEIVDRLALLPSWTIEELDVVQLSDMTRKKKRFPCYGLQWGTTVYLYPVEQDLLEIFVAPPGPQLRKETRMYGGVWHKDESQKLWILEWSESTIKDFYLNNILIHELGHLVDDRNTNDQARERFADWFAIEYGYLASRKALKKRNSAEKTVKRHDFS